MPIIERSGHPMNFPPWIENKKHAQKARLRLKHMLQVAALNHYGRTSMHDLARDAGCNHSSIFNAINRGYFTESMALSIEQVFGRDRLKHEALMRPLDVTLPVAVKS